MEKVRATGVPEAMIEAERDAWILVAARWPEQIPAFMADKTRQLSDPKLIHLYQLIGQLLEAGADTQEQVVRDMADVMVDMFEEAAARGDLDLQEGQLDDAAFVGLLDSLAGGSHPMVPRLRELIAERGWSGWTRVERS